jgi:uncharacterized protein (TIGR03382 family)
MNAPRENIGEKAPVRPDAGSNGILDFTKKAAAFVAAVSSSSPALGAPTVVDASFAPTITAVSTDPNVDERTPSALGSDVYVFIYPDFDADRGVYGGIHKVNSPFSMTPMSGLEQYGFVIPLGGGELLGTVFAGRDLDQLNYDATTSSWGASGYLEPFDVLGTDFSDDHPGFARTPNGDVIVGSHAQRGPDSIQLHEMGVSRELITTEVFAGFSLDMENRELYFADYSDWDNPSIWVTSLDTWAPRLVVEGAFDPYLDATTTPKKLYFSTDVDPTDTTNYDVLSIQKLPEVAPELPVVAPASIEGQDGTNLLARPAEVDCTEVPTYTFEVALPEGAVVSSENLFLIEGDVSTPLTGRLVNGKLAVDVPTAGMPLGVPCRVTGIAVGEDARAPFEATLVAIPSCEVSLEDEVVTHLDTAPETGEVVIDGEAGTLEYTVDFLAKFADGSVTADVKGAGSIVYGVDESGRSFLRSSDGIIRFLSGTEAAMVKFAPTEGSVTIKDVAGKVLVTLQAGEEAVVSIDYLSPADTETPENPDTEDTDVDEPKSTGCDTSGKTPNGVAAGVLAAVMAVLRRRRKN